MQAGCRAEAGTLRPVSSTLDASFVPRGPGGGLGKARTADPAPVTISLPEHAERALTPAEKDAIAMAALGRPLFRGGDWFDYLEHTGRGAAGGESSG